MSDAWVGVVGTFVGALIGAGITMLTEGLRRRWARRDEERAELIKRAEELADLTAQLYDWQTRCLSDAFDGRLDPPPSMLFRVGILVSSYFPTLEPLASQVGRGMESVHHTCAQLSFEVQKNRQAQRPPMPALIDGAQKALASLTKSCVELTEGVSRLIREANNRR